MPFVLSFLFLVVALDPPSATDRLADWFRQVRAGDERVALWQDATLQAARLSCEGDAELHADFERFEEALRAYLAVDDADAHESSPATLVATIRVNRCLALHPGLARIEAYADLLELLDLVAAEGTPAALSVLLDVASFDADRVYTPREWRLRQPFRPHLVRREARFAILRIPFSRSVEALLPALRDTRVEAARRVVAADLVATLVRRDAISAFHRFRLLEACLDLVLEDGDTDVRVAAAGAVYGVLAADREITLPDPKLERLLALVRPDAPDSLNLAVLRVLRASPREVVIRGLAERLARIRTWRVRSEEGLRVTLDHLTPVDFSSPSRPEAILAWYEAEMGTTRFQDFLLERQRRWRRRARPELDKQYADAPRFYGVPIVGRRVVFVIDGSGSMQEILDPETMKSKIAAARAELSNAVAGLDETVEFDIISFNDDIRQLAPGFLHATKGNRRKAERFIQGTGSFGWTNLFGGLTQAIGLTFVGARLEGGRTRAIPDQIVLLSDGVPTRGQMTNGLDIVEEMTRLNRMQELRLDTIAFGAEADREFLRALAARNGGVTVVFPPE